MESTLIAGIITIFSFTTLADAAAWGYVGETGPNEWDELFPNACAGQFQSPIDIVTTQTVYDPNLRDFSIFYDPPLPGSKFFVHNNGHALQVNTEGKFHVSNGGLRYIYNTAQFHFHWGHKNHHGSEHTIDGRAAPIEMHIVSWNSDKYNSIAEAATEPEGLAVLGILFEVTEHDNPALEPIVQVLVNVRDPDKKMKSEIPAVSMRHYLPRAPDRYYRYNGSLTTPGCFESVVWTVFHEKQSISRRQLHVFRQILKPKKHHKRSTNERRVVREVLGELGIEDNLQEQRRFRRNLEEKVMVNTGKQAAAEQQQPPAIDVPASPEPPKSSNHGNHDAGHSSHSKPKSDAALSNTRHGPSYNTNHSKSIRKFLVNNFRPVQPLNDRVVYRSFPFFDEPIESVRTVYVEVEKEPVSKGQDSGASALASLSILTFSSFIVTKWFV